MSDRLGHTTVSDTKARKLTGSSAACITLLALYLIPLWWFRWIPTTDGASHVANGIILRELLSGDPWYSSFYEFRPNVVPNLTGHLILAGLTATVSPMTAERILTTLYLCGVVLAFTYFLRACKADVWYWLPFCFLFVYPRVFFLGFYNFCLGMVLFWFILGYCIHRRNTMTLGTATTLACLLTVTFFTHLVAYLLSCLCLFLVLVIGSERRIRSSAWAIVSIGATACLPYLYFQGTQGFTESRSAPGPVARIVDRVSNLPETVAESWYMLNYHLYRVYDTSGMLWIAVFLLWEVSLALSLYYHWPRRDSRLKGALLAIGATLAALYFVLPDNYGSQGGFLRVRLVFLPMMVTMGCFATFSSTVLRKLLRTGMALLVLVNLYFVTNYVRNTCHEIDAFTAGVDHIEKKRLLKVIQVHSRPNSPGYFTTAGSYYCWQTKSIDLENYEAAKEHFPIQWKNEAPRMSPDTLVYWKADETIQPPDGFQKIFDQGQLQIYCLSDASKSAAQ